MADEASKDPAVAEDALPMQKTSPVAYIVAGVAVLVLGGLVVFGMSGGDDAKEEVKATEKAADDAQGMTKEEIEERRAHLQKTQAAPMAAAADDAEEEEKKKQTEQQKQAAAQPAPSPGSSAPAKKPVNTKKTSDSLDALGADITSALQ